MSETIHVAAGALFDAAGRVLVTRRAANWHQGGLWEFPGGKLEPGEDAAAALIRELQEELGVTPTRLRPLICIPHHYPDRRVLLDIWRVDAWRGSPSGREDQPLAWHPPEELPGLAMPAADRPVVTAVRLPDICLITPDPGPQRQAFLVALERALEQGVRLVQLRTPSLGPGELESLGRQVLKRCRATGARLLINGGPDLVRRVGAHGVHLNSRRLMTLDRRPDLDWVAASCHNAVELAHARKLGLDFAVLSPVLATATHPGAPALGWRAFRNLVKNATLPVYALGGLAVKDLPMAWSHGAQGIAGIRRLWPGSVP